MLNLATLPGPGDEATWPACSNHPNDPRTPAANTDALRAGMSNELRHALVRGAFVSWGEGWKPELAADAVHGCGQGNQKATDAFRDLHAAIANGADDATVAKLAREYQRVSFECAADDLTECANDGRRITFPAGSKQ